MIVIMEKQKSPAIGSEKNIVTEIKFLTEALKDNFWLNKQFLRRSFTTSFKNQFLASLKLKKKKMCNSIE